TEEWPGNARILEVVDVLSRYSDGRPDCLVVRRDSFGDESSNKNFVNLNRDLRAEAGTLSWEKDLGGPGAPLGLAGTRDSAPLTPAGVPESRENGVCEVCPPPLTVDPDDHVAPGLTGAAFRSTREIRVAFTEAMDFASANNPANYLLLDTAQRSLSVLGVAAAGNRVTLQVEAPDFAETYTLYVKGLTRGDPAPDRAAGSTEGGGGAGPPAAAAPGRAPGRGQSPDPRRHDRRSDARRGGRAVVRRGARPRQR